MVGLPLHLLLFFLQAMASAPDRSVWEACAGISGKTPKIGSLVYYFPRGHMEQASALPDSSSLNSVRACYLCKVREIQLLSNEDTDDVYSELGLDPTEDSESVNEPVGEEEITILSFAKVLTPSDANNGGGFSVPRFCADSIFPKLDYSVEPPSQLLNVRDLRGRVWEFRHIFRGTPRRHLLTTGWSRFVNSKRLIAGDSVIFMKNKCGEVFVGLRRNSQSLGFKRNFRAKISPGDVIKAVKLAENGQPFTVIYYPNSSFSNFVVEKGAVENAARVPWSVGLRVKMSVESEDPLKNTWLQGTVSFIRHPSSFNYSPWRSLEVLLSLIWNFVFFLWFNLRIVQVAWDEAETGYIMKRVSPWEVEVIPGVGHVAGPKRVRKSQERPAGGPERRMRTWANENLPSGMQGARQDPELVLEGVLPGGSFQLFGKTILTGHLNGAEADLAVDREHGGGTVDLRYEFSLSSQGKQLYEEPDKPSHRVPALES